MPYFYFDSWYFILVVPAFLFALYAQFKVKSTYAKYSKVASTRGLTGAEVSRALLDSQGLNDVQVRPGRGFLTDNYDPRKKIITLSESVYSGTSLSASGVAAHETGHAIQHAEKYAPISVRNAIVPLANIGSQLGPYMAIFGLFLNSGFLINLGIVLFGVAVVFYLITLPVEFDASRRAVSILESRGILQGSELMGARKVLGAAAMTYVASAAVAMAQLLRLILLSNSRNRD